MIALQRAGAKSSTPSILPRAPLFTCAIGVRVAPDLVARLAPAALDRAFDEERAKLQEEQGLPFPGITLWTSDALPASTCEILMRDVPQARLELPADQTMLPDAASDPALAGRCTKRGPAGGLAESYWIDDKAVPAGARAWRAEQVVAHETIALLRRNAHLFLGIQEAQWILDQLGVDYPGLVAEVQKALPTQRIADVLRRLLEEHIPIRNARDIMESLVAWGPKEKDMLMLAEYVRGDLSRYLAYRAARGARQLPAVLLDMAVEQHIRQSIKQTPAGNFLALPPEQVRYLVDSVASFVGEAPRDDVALVTSMDVRRYTRRMIEARLDWLPVYSYQELGDQVQLQPVGRVTMPTAAHA
ncbi:FHIPEP family type III secretion protein [Burkholderia pseudomallei]